MAMNMTSVVWLAPRYGANCINSIYAGGELTVYVAYRLF